MNTPEGGRRLVRGRDLGKKKRLKVGWERKKLSGIES